MGLFDKSHPYNPNDYRPNPPPKAYFQPQTEKATPQQPTTGQPQIVAKPAYKAQASASASGTQKRKEKQEGGKGEAVGEGCGCCAAVLECFS